MMTIKILPRLVNSNVRVMVTIQMDVFHGLQSLIVLHLLLVYLVVIFLLQQVLFTKVQILTLIIIIMHLLNNLNKHQHQPHKPNQFLLNKHNKLQLHKLNQLQLHKLNQLNQLPHKIIIGEVTSIGITGEITTITTIIIICGITTTGTIGVVIIMPQQTVQTITGTTGVVIIILQLTIIGIIGEETGVVSGNVVINKNVYHYTHNVVVKVIRELNVVNKVFVQQ
jgi:hypothetical protein